ncbi:MAG: PEP-CTERM sorting domain-containing protein [Kordiimonas sp.]
MSRLLGGLVAGVISAATLCGSVSAQDSGYPYIDLLADAGDAINPVTLGNGVQLNGCGSQVHAASGTPTFGLCESGMDLTEFSITWKASLNQYADGWNPNSADWVDIATFSGTDVLNGLTLLASTGAGTAFATAGNYVIGLWVEMTSSSSWGADDVTVTLPGGIVRYTGSDSWLMSDGTTNYSFNLTSVTVNAAPVPEPASAILLLTGMAYIARRERKRKKVTA